MEVIIFVREGETEEINKHEINSAGTIKTTEKKTSSRRN